MINYINMLGNATGRKKTIKRVLGIHEQFTGNEGNNVNKELEDLIKMIESFAPDILGMRGYSIYGGMFNVPRKGWEIAGINPLLVENVGEHCQNTKKAASAVILGTPEKINNHNNFELMLECHDMPEGFSILPDITPHCDYTSEQKKILERYAFLCMKEILLKKGEKQISALEEYIKQKTKDAINANYLDKMDAGVKALDYEKIGYKDQVSEFHPSILEKISDSPYFTKIYEIMLEREFKNIPAHLQYFILLELAGDYDKWIEKLQSF